MAIKTSPGLNSQIRWGIELHNAVLMLNRENNDTVLTCQTQLLQCM